MTKNYTVSKGKYFCTESGHVYAVSVEKAADYFEVSTRRIRKMLSDGKLSGVKKGTTWHVFYPYQHTFGKRGPLISKFTNEGIKKAPTFRGKRRNTSNFDNQKLKKGE